MTRFSGVVGFAQQQETKPGVWTDVLVERPYKGTVERHAVQTRTGDELNPDLTVNNSISIIADEYARTYFPVIRFVVMGGVAWSVENVDVLQRPRLLLRLGGVWNGGRAGSPTP
jgi:hypothetical protein